MGLKKKRHRKCNGNKKERKCDNRNVAETWSFVSDSETTETHPVHGKLDRHVSAGRKRDGFKQLHVSVEFTTYGNTLFRPVNCIHFMTV